MTGIFYLNFMKCWEEIDMVRTHEIRMVTGVTREYFCRKSDLTARIDELRQDKLFAYRTTLFCECSDNSNVRVTGAVIVNHDGKVVNYLIRCNACAGRKEACDDTL